MKRQYPDNGLVPDDIFMSKRLQVATPIMQGMVANCNNDTLTAEQMTNYAYILADSLIAKEEE